MRARLSTEGYPANLLDRFLGTGAATVCICPSDNVFNAMRTLGPADTADLRGLIATAGRLGFHAPRLGAPEFSFEPYDNALMFKQPDWPGKPAFALEWLHQADEEASSDLSELSFRTAPPPPRSIAH